jgi:hypothetical protein
MQSHNVEKEPLREKEGREASPVIEEKYLPRTELNTGSSYSGCSSDDDDVKGTWRTTKTQL